MTAPISGIVILVFDEDGAIHGGVGGSNQTCGTFDEDGAIHVGVADLIRLVERLTRMVPST